MVRKTTLGVITVATNEYVNYWADQARSFAKNPSQDLEVTLHVFTDQPDFIDKVASTIAIRVVTHVVSSYKWPQAALYRYKLIHEFSEQFSEDILMHLDADMLVQAPINSLALSQPIKNGICLVRHPGFFRPNGVARMLFYLRNPQVTLGDIASVVRMGSLGTWETNKHSLAFVPRTKRKQYVCGGTWWGLRPDVLALSENLSNRVSLDEENGITAIWHDESHLNWWASKHEHGSEDPRYCFSAGFVQLREIPNIIQAVDKKPRGLEPTQSGHTV
jgi:hypothetical protein